MGVCNYPDCDGGPATGYCDIRCRAEPEVVPVTIVCEACGGEGREISGQYEDEQDHGPCRYCDGDGRVEIETQPVTLEDLADPRFR